MAGLLGIFKPVLVLLGARAALAQLPFGRECD
jgi:hypothetical protein